LLKLPPLDDFRKVRREVLNNINKIRAERGLTPLSNDQYINIAACQYAQYCANNERDGNPTVLEEIFKTNNAPGTYKGITGYRILEEEEQVSAQTMFNKLFLEAHGLTFEVNETREEMLNPDYTHVGFGFSLAGNVYVIAEIFSTKKLRLEGIKATEDEKGIEINGKMLDDTLGPYAAQVIDPASPTKPVCLIGPEGMKLDMEKKEFRIFIDKPELLYATPPFVCEIYLRNNPQTIKYGGPITQNLAKDLVHLQLAYKTPMELFPDPRILMEETHDEAKEKQEELEKRKVKSYL
jgi:hypothetical protein